VAADREKISLEIVHEENCPHPAAAAAAMAAAAAAHPSIRHHGTTGTRR